MKGLLGKKIGMTQLFDSNGVLVPITIVEVEPNFVLAIKTKEKDGYDATQLAFMKISSKNVTKPRAGIFKKAGTEPRRYISEFRNMTGFNVGDSIDGTLFSKGEIVDIEGVTRGHGFTGAIKR
jgi:large subunit ribosomal protein L3